jgi:hypothetical protein
MMEPATAMLTVGFPLGPSAFSSPASSSFLCFFFCFLGAVSSSVVAATQASPTSSLTLLSLLLLVFLPPDLLGVGGIHGGGVGFRQVGGAV